MRAPMTYDDSANQNGRRHRRNDIIISRRLLSKTFTGITTSNTLSLQPLGFLFSSFSSPSSSLSARNAASLTRRAPAAFGD